VRFLELKIPPPLAVILLGAAMYAADRSFPGLRLDDPPGRRLLTWLLAVGGLGMAISAVVSIVRARTTVNPLKPERTSTLITSGMYRWSRNPIYLGDTLVLLAWATYLATPLAFAMVPVFVIWMSAFQIAPEERMLRERFGPAYEAYCRRVGRWWGRA
jgi:protein-S-isoprenylcysteine O-methyltransferase Ste14